MNNKQFFMIWIIACTAILFSTPDPEQYVQFKGGTTEELDSDIIVPFEIESTHRMKFDVLINGNSFEMIMDTGGQTFLEAELGDSLELEIINIPPNNNEFAVIESLEIGGVVVKGMKVGLIGFNDTFKFDLKGMIGSDFLRFYQMEINYQEQHVTFRSPLKLIQTNDNEHVIDMDIIFPYFPTVEILVNDQFLIPGMVDTGLHFGFVFPITWLENLDEEEQLELIESDGYFVRWPWDENPQNFLYRMKEIQLGDIVLKDIPVIFSEIPDFLNDSVVLIGKYFLENYITTIDYPNRQLKLEEYIPSEYSLDYTAGIMLADKDDKLQITGIWNGSPAFEKGIATEDTLVAVTGLKYGEISNKQIGDLLMNINHTDIEITILRNGVETEIVLPKRNLFK